MRTEWWEAFVLPVNWKLAQEAFLEQYHVIETHPELVIPKRFAPKDPAAFDPEVFIDAELHYLHVMSEGMGGMVHANDVAVAERQRTMALSKDPQEAMATWHDSLNDAVVAWHRARLDHARPQRARGPGHRRDDVLRLPPLLRAPHVLQRHLVSLPAPRPRRDPHGDLVADPLPRRPRARAPPSAGAQSLRRRAIPPIPTQDFSNLPRQQRGLHNEGFEYMRLSEGIEGGIANFERTLDGFLAGRPYDQLEPALRAVNVNPLEQPVVDLGF